MANATPVLAFTIPLLTLAVLAVAQPLDDHPGRLPEPTGAFGIGRVTLLIEDPTRLEPLDATVAPRKIMVDVWYPADRSASTEAVPAKYLDLAAFERGLGAEGLRKQLGEAYDVIKTERLKTHSVEQAPFARSLRLAPVLLFSPGGGMIRELYTSQMEELASHGYLVAAMTHTYDGFLSVFPDGTSKAHSGARWPKIPSVEGEANLNQLEWHTADMRAVLDSLSRLTNAASPSPLAGRVDLARVGAFGHSFGGVAAAHACQKDPRIKACLNQDGAMGMKPFYLDDRDWGMDQAFLLLERPPNREPLTDGDLAALKMTRERAMQLIARLNADRDQALRSTGLGSYRVLLRRNGTTHMDFSDLPVLSARSRTEFEQRTRVLALVRSYTRAFFDKYLRGRKAPLLDRSTPDEILEAVETFRPAKRRNGSNARAARRKL